MILSRGTLHRTIPGVAKTVTNVLPLGWGGGRVGRFVGVDVRDNSRQWKKRGFVLFRTLHATEKRIPPYYRIAAIPCLETSCHVALS